MGILISLFIVASVYEPLSLEKLEGRWTIGVRFDNLLNAENHLSTSVSYYEEDTYVYLNTYQSSSLGFPSEYSLLWRFKKTMAMGIEGGIYYYDTPSGKYKRYRYEGDLLFYKMEGEITDNYWHGWVGIEIYKYFYASKFLSPFITIFPNLDIIYDRYKEEGIRCESDTVTYSTKRNRDRWDYGVDINCGVEYLFKLWDIQFGVRAKTSLAVISRYYSEYIYSNFEENVEEYRNEREEKGSRVNFYLPTQGKSSLWLCCYF